MSAREERGKRDQRRRDARAAMTPATAAERARLTVLVDRLAAVRTAKASLEGEEVEILAEAERIAAAQIARLESAASRDREMPRRSIAAELALAVRANDRTLQGEMEDAGALARLLPATLRALRAGRISRAHARVILETGHRVADAAARARFEAAVLAKARTQTPGRVRAFARSLAENLDGRTAEDRRMAAQETRAVTARDIGDGVGELCLHAPVALVFGIRDRITQQATAIRAAAGGTDEAVRDTRTMDQIRADVVTDMLLTGAPAIDPTHDTRSGGLGAIRAHVQVTIPVTTLTGVTDTGAELDGHAPVDPESARRLAGDCPSWDRIMVHPITGRVLAVDRYRPSEDLRRTLYARNRHCRFPGCRMPARRCEIDHTQDAAKGGATALRNLCCLCVRHHTLKHATEWTVVQLDGGALEWTSPDGRTYTDEPPPHVVFLPEPEPPPF